MTADLVLLCRAPDQPGTLAGLSELVTSHGGDVRDAQSYGDEGTGQFFTRMHLRLPKPALEEFRVSIHRHAEARHAQWQLRDMAYRPRILIAVSRFDHCLVDLLHRAKTGSLDGDIVAVLSNHEDARPLVEWHGVPFHHLPVTPDTKGQQERAFLDLVAQTGADLVVLARYMQILSEDLCAQLAGRCINIHHSFLPGFKGARPYHRAFERGVKLIGATAHYVTTDLDEGPIIEQDVRRVTHATSVAEMIAIGRETESSVLARAVGWHLQHRVMLNGQKTVVFS